MLDIMHNSLQQNQAFQNATQFVQYMVNTPVYEEHGDVKTCIEILKKQYALIKELQVVIQDLVNMVEFFPEELHRGHPDVVAAEKTLELISTFKV
jgi:hemerythrin-like domain-containing protein